MTLISGVIDAVGGLGNRIDGQTEAIKENTETNKNILQKIIDIPGQIISGLLDMIKSIFIPSDDFFTNWLDDLNTYFGDKFGILYYPFQLLIDFFNRVSNISDSTTAIMNIPEFKINFMGYSATLLKAYQFDFNSILVNDTYKTIHNVYLGIVDIILWLSLVYLAKKCITNILGGMNDSIDYANEAYEESEEQNKRRRKI